MASNQEIAATFRPHWTAVWTRILRDWLQWNTSRIDSWFDCWENELSARDASSAPWIYHDPVLRKIAPLFVPDDLAHRIKTQHNDPNQPNDLLSLLEQIERCAAWAPDYTYCDAPSYDWTSAKVRVEELLSEVGVSWPDPSHITEYEHRIRRGRSRTTRSS